MKSPKQLVLFLVFALLFLSSCIITVVDYQGRGDFPGRARFRRTYPLKPGGTIILDNTRGDIEIRGWEKEEVEIIVEEDAPQRQRRAFYVLPKDFSELKIQVDRFEDLVKIKSPGGGRGDEARTFHFFLNVPRSVKLKSVGTRTGDVFISDIYGEALVVVEEGSIRVENFSGSLEASANNGDVEAELLDLRDGDEIKLITREGDINVRLEPEVTAIWETDAPRGNVSSDFEIDRPSGDQEATGRIREGKIRITLKALNGDIRIKEGK